MENYKKYNLNFLIEYLEKNKIKHNCNIWVVRIHHKEYNKLSLGKRRFLESNSKYKISNYDLDSNWNDEICFYEIFKEPTPAELKKWRKEWAENERSYEKNGKKK